MAVQPRCNVIALIAEPPLEPQSLSVNLVPGRGNARGQGWIGEVSEWSADIRSHLLAHTVPVDESLLGVGDVERIREQVEPREKA